MPAICSQRIVSIPHTAKLGRVQPQPPQRHHAFGLPRQMHAITMSHVGREGYTVRPRILIIARVRPDLPRSPRCRGLRKCSQDVLVQPFLAKDPGEQSRTDQDVLSLG